MDTKARILWTTIEEEKCKNFLILFSWTPLATSEMRHNLGIIEEENEVISSFRHGKG